MPSVKRENMYRLDYLPTAIDDILEAELYLYDHNPRAADKFIEALKHQEKALTQYPFMYAAYPNNRKYRIMPLPYQYLCFYYVDDEAEAVKVYRVIRGMRDMSNILKGRN